MQPPQMFHQYPLSPAPDPNTVYPPPLSTPGADHHVRSLRLRLAVGFTSLKKQQKQNETKQSLSISNNTVKFCGSVNHSVALPSSRFGSYS